jgi:L-alanine-DL-glutamate epimerase-like enolase superfamily enzyme
VDVIVVELENSDGVAGLGFSYVLGGGGALALRAVQDQIGAFVTGKELIAPRALWTRIVDSFNRTGRGVNLIGLAALDVAVWDLHSKSRGLPLSVALGGYARLTPVYGSGGFNASQRPEEASDIALAHASRGFTAVKPRVSGKPQDQALLLKVRASLGSDTHVMLDANEKCDLTSAFRLMNIGRDIGALFIEEPLPANAFSAYKALCKAATLPIATGEHLQDIKQFGLLAADRVASVLQPDLALVGGLTPILDIAIMAESLGISVSPHFLPGLFVHVAAASRSITWLEDFPLLEPLFEGWATMSKAGSLEPSPAAGHGLTLSEYGAKLLKD